MLKKKEKRSKKLNAYYFSELDGCKIAVFSHFGHFLYTTIRGNITTLKLLSPSC